MKWLSGFVIFLTIALAFAEQARYDNYRVYNLNIGNEIQLEALKQIENNPDGYNFWEYPSGVGQNVKIMVSPHKFDEFSNIAEKLNIQNDIFISNVQEKIDGVQPSVKSADAFAFTVYQTLEEMYSWMDEIVAQNPDVASTIIGGSTYEGREIRGVKISYKEGNKGVFIEGTMHAREWISGATSTYILNELLTSTDPAVIDIAENFDWYIFPVTNPDGYAFTHSSDRMWRKTRTPYSTCFGADPNRNWGHMWFTGGSSNNPCSDTYAGPSAFSEIETASLSEYYKTLNNMTTYISFHSYSQLLLVPFGYTTAPLLNYNDLITIGNQALTALTARHGTTFKIGNIAEAIYIASGGSIDWIRAEVDTPLTFCYELRDLGQFGFLLPATQIIPVGQEMVDSVVALLNGGRALGYH